MWTLIIVISTPGGPIFEEFPAVFLSRDECMAVTQPWFNVPMSNGHVAIAVCEQVKI